MLVKKTLLHMAAAAAIVLATGGVALAIDIDAGQIINDDDAKAKCPKVCANKKMTWNGQWDTKQSGQSVCGCKK